MWKIVRALLQGVAGRNLSCRRLATVLTIVCLASSQSFANELTETSLAPGYFGAPFALPPAGSYTLPPVGNAADGDVLDSSATELTLHDLYGDKIVLLSFMYGSCRDLNGCPLVKAVFFKMKSALESDPLLVDKLRLISLSFDPVRDTPAAMKQYGADLGDGALEWRFLTTRSESELEPILSAYNQAIRHEHKTDGEEDAAIAHILRVFLIDHTKRIRNIYSVSFLQEEILLNDVRTLLLEEKVKSAVLSDTQQGTENPRFRGMGDGKQGYEFHEARSRALASRSGVPTDLLGIAQSPPLGLPPLLSPAENALSELKVSLGRKLFYDRRLSLNNTMSCAMCHIPEQGFTSNEMETAVGIEGRTVRRSSPTIYNVAYMQRLFHDGRESTLEQQVWSPLLAKNEMGVPAIGWLIEKISELPDYRNLFERAFNGKGPTMETIGMAIASYERTLLSADSRFDRWYFGKQTDSISEEAIRGFEVFTGKGDCDSCHLISDEFALFTDNQLHNTGIGYDASMGKPAASREITVAPGTSVKVAQAIIDSVSEAKTNDLGLYEITQEPRDRWKYRTPSLRNVALTAPYMHNGSIGTLEDVVEFYNKGGIANELLDSRIRPLGLNENEKEALVAFLETLTGSNVDTLISDAFAAPVGDPR